MHISKVHALSSAVVNHHVNLESKNKPLYGARVDGYIVG